IRAFFLCGRHTKASMEAAQLTLAIRSTFNTTRIIQQYMQHQNLAKRYRARRRRQRGHVSDQDMYTDFSKSMGPANACIMVLMGQVHAVERRFWARETSTDWWDRIVLQVWDDSQRLRNFRMRKGTFMELCDLLSPALKRMNSRMRAALTVEKRMAIALWKLAMPERLFPFSGGDRLDHLPNSSVLTRLECEDVTVRIPVYGCLCRLAKGIGLRTGPQTVTLKVTAAEQAPDPWNKTCSFNKAGNIWLPVEGTRDICSCCETGNRVGWLEDRLVE
ncbi:unnamed protein product, partial [Lepidochelys olivacea]